HPSGPALSVSRATRRKPLLSAQNGIRNEKRARIRRSTSHEVGANPQSKLPHLATYLGHKDITSTPVYLNITPELLHEASERFRKNGAAILQTGGSLCNRIPSQRCCMRSSTNGWGNREIC